MSFLMDQEEAIFGIWLYIVIVMMLMFNNFYAWLATFLKFLHYVSLKVIPVKRLDVGYILPMVNMGFFIYQSDHCQVILYKITDLKNWHLLLQGLFNR